MSPSEHKIIKKKSLLEALVIPLVIALGVPLAIYIKLLEPSFSSFRVYSAEAASLEAKVDIIKKQYEEKDKLKPQKSAEKPVIYLLNYLDSASAKSNIKIKSFQEAGSQGSRGVSSFQLRFGCNADTFSKFLYFAENSVPPLAISNWRVTSIAGGSYSGMRQLEGLATLTFVSAGAGRKAVFAKLEGQKSWWRDVFAEVSREQPKAAPPPKVVEDTEPDPIIKWTLTAQMSDGENELIVVTFSLTNRRVLVDLKPLGAVVSVKEELVTITAGGENLDWKLGEAIEQTKLPKKLADAILAAKEASSPSATQEKTVVKEEEKQPAPAVIENNQDGTSRTRIGTGRTRRPRPAE